MTEADAVRLAQLTERSAVAAIRIAVVAVRDGVREHPRRQARFEIARKRGNR